MTDDERRDQSRNLEAVDKLRRPATVLPFRPRRLALLTPEEEDRFVANSVKAHEINWSFR